MQSRLLCCRSEACVLSNVRREPNYTDWFGFGDGEARGIDSGVISPNAQLYVQDITFLGTSSN